MEATVDRKWNNFTFTDARAASKYINKNIMPFIYGHTVVMEPTEGGYQLQITGPTVNKTWTK